MKNLLKQEIIASEQTVALLPKDRRALACIFNYVILQCILVFAGAATIMHCLWSPEYAAEDYDKLVRIMYLFDSQACGYNLRASRAISNLQLSNFTGGLAVLPITWTPAIVTVSTRLTAKTRRYIELSIIFHALWLIVTVIFKIIRDIRKVKFLKLALVIYFYTSVFMIVFDLSMAIVYITHIKQSLTKGMILRYSGWGVEMKLKNYEGFGGWLPIGASICWTRGIVFFVINVYCCRTIHLVRRKVKKREIKKSLILDENPPVPEATYKEPLNSTVLYYRTGEMRPFVKQSYFFQ